MKVPYDQLSPAALRGVIQEYVSRDGTDHSSMENRIESVQRQLEAGTAELHFDHASESCNIVIVAENPRQPG